MSGVLVGFSIIVAVILVGYVAGRASVGGPTAPYVLNRVAFFVTNPALLFSVLSKADLHVIFSSYVDIAFLDVVVVGALYVAASALFFRQRVAETTLGAMAATYVNANNIGLPVAVYVLGSASYVVPVLLLQVIVIAPVALTILDISSHGGVSLGRLITQPVRNPMIIASVSGVVVSAIGVTPPTAVLRPIDLLAGAAVPLVLLAFGMSLNGAAPFRHPAGRRELAVASVLKCAVMPLVAFVLARFVFHLQAQSLYAAVVLAALPTAQNIYNFASRYERGEAMARDAVLVTTALSAVSVAAIAVLLVRP